MIGGLEKIFTVTVDNASANDNVVKYLKGRFGDRDGVLEGKYMHVQCVACAYCEAFELEDRYYKSDLGDKFPRAGDWEKAEWLVLFLKNFCNLTLRVSGYKYVTADVVFDEETVVPDSLESQTWSPVVTANLLEIVQHGFYKMFLEYQKIYRRECVSTPSPVVAEVRFSNEVSNLVELNEEDDFLKARKKAKKGQKRQDKSEMEIYLNEDCEEDEEFDILEWWKRESHRFPILSRMARDVLAVPVSTVASESAFSTGGRVLDKFRSSLSPKIGQAIICAQDWMWSEGMPIKVEEDLAQLEKLEQEFTDFDTYNSPGLLTCVYFDDAVEMWKS